MRVFVHKFQTHDANILVLERMHKEERWKHSVSELLFAVDDWLFVFFCARGEIVAVGNGCREVLKVGIP